MVRGDEAEKPDAVYRLELSNWWEKLSSTEIFFKVVNETTCPYYKVNDAFKLSGNALSVNFDSENIFISTAIVRFPKDRNVCRILISGDPVGATVKVEESATLAVIEGSDFKKIGNKFPSIQMYLAKISGGRFKFSPDFPVDQLETPEIGSLTEILLDTSSIINADGQ